MEVEQDNPYHLAQVLRCHTKSARCVDARGNFIISGSEDKTVKIFQKLPDTEIYELRNELTIFDKMIYSVKVRNDCKGFFVSGQDQQIYIINEEGSPEGVLQGHQGTVNSLSQIDDELIASGSWDGTAKIWNFKTGQLIRTFEGHSHAVSVLALKSLDLLITGSQDKTLRFFELSSGVLKKEVKGAHSDIIRDLKFIQDVGIISCSNDETVKLWTYEGDEIGQYSGHKGFVFAVNSISFSKYVSGGDDKCLKFWKDGQEIQTLQHPGTVWNIAILDNSDVVTSCSDGVVRIFSNDNNRIASEDDIKLFETEVQEANKQGQGQGMQMSDEELSKLPTDINSVKGKKNGEYKMFREGNNVIAYMWVQAESRWEKIGDVTGTSSGGGGAHMGKRYYAGDGYFQAGEYDYIFAVEDDSGATKQLPFNDGESTFITAKTYCAREGLSFNFQQQIINFLEQNTRSGQQAKQKQFQQQAEQSQFQGVKKEVKKTLSKSEFFPLMTFFKFSTFNKDACQKKIQENNQKIKENPELKQLIIHDIEQKRLDGIITFIASQNPAKNLDTAEWEMITERLLKWPVDLRTPVYDLLRIFVMHPQAEKLFTGLDSGMNIFLDICTLVQSNQTADGIVALLLKLFSNCFQIINGRMSLQRNYKIILDALNVAAKRQNNNVLNALSSLFVNYSIDISQRVQGGKAGNFQDYIEAMSKLGIQLLKQQLNGDTELRVLVGLGNLQSSCPKLCKNIIGSTVNSYKLQNQDQQNQQCLSDLKDHVNLM